MKKIVAFLVVIMCASISSAQNFGILVHSKMYYAGKENTTPLDPSFQEFMVLGLSLKAGDKCQLYDGDYGNAWTVNLDGASTSEISLGGGFYNVSTTGCYDFYIKIKYENDQLYVGKASGCDNTLTGIDITQGGGNTNPDSGDQTTYTTSAPAKCPDVMLQAFYWDSYQDQGYGRTKWVDYVNGNNGTDAVEVGQWFDLIWLPPMSKATGGTGYLPTDYSSLTCDWGTEKKLRELIGILHKNGARVVADIVVNHCAAQNGWCDFGTYNFGTYGKFSPTGAWICSTDEMNTSSDAGSCKGKATGAADDGYGSEANYDSGRDWDHKNSKVREMIKAYLKWLRNDVKIDGFRYDYCKGFHNSHINEYNKDAGAYFSVMEYWDGDAGVLQSRLNDAGWNTLTFDFATKYQAFNNGIAGDNYQGLRGAGLPGAGKARYAVTFLDSHDSFQRDDNEFCGKGNSMTVCGDKILQCYAYLLSMPGVPCVFFPHWKTFKDPIKAMINARYKTGVHSESSVSDEAGNGYYKATITGTNGTIRLLVGPNSGYNDTPSGYTLASKGTNYGVYYKTNSARGDKNTERVDRTQGIEEINESSSIRGEKFMENGQLFIRCGEQVFDIMGRKVK